MKFSQFLNEENSRQFIFEVALKIAFDKGDSKEDLDRLGNECKNVFLLCCLEGEVINGGFDQLFTNSLGNYCLEILDALSIVGAKASHMLLAKALSWFPNSSPSKDRQERWDQRIQFAENIKYINEINSLDSEFFETRGELVQLIEQYIRKNRNALISKT